MDEMKATPRPWKYDKSPVRRNEYHITNGAGGVRGHVAYAGLVVIAEIGKSHTDCTDNTPEAEANAQLIVTAVNERESLLAENKRLREALEKIAAMPCELDCASEWDEDDACDCFTSVARAALAEKEGK